ncbi:DeoR/GlpR family DNA-binding transcription regulator [Paenibacillus sp. FSL R10-2734]|uniref:DeoR/GlpR family DNA-binding transcription regulator n=1 Tax=Paenibacillus sp. FSL R10-2734 TaxID=2954691 RepID=UPI0030DD9FAE
MLATERQQIILAELKQRGNVSVKDLKVLLRVSLDTVRRDLEHMEGMGQLLRVHGGAVIKDDSVTNRDFTLRKVAQLEQKQQLAANAMAFVKENQAISLNAGTTNIEVARQLAAHFERLTVITNSIKVAEILAVKSGFHVIVLGGVLNHDEFSLYGGSIQQEISKFNIDVAFISINAISLDKGLTDFRQGESEVIQVMIQNAVKRIVVADSSKFETVSYLNICGFDEIDTIVTDIELDLGLRLQYEGRGIQIIQ